MGTKNTDALGPTLTVTTEPADPSGGDAVTATAVLVNDLSLIHI